APMTAVADRLREAIGVSDIDGETPLGFFDDVVARRPIPGWDTRFDYERSHARVNVPVHLTAGWYDVILGHDLDHFQRMRATSAAGAHTSITIGPWSHSNFTNLVGELDYGRRSTGASLDLGPSIAAEMTEWFRVKLTDTPSSLDEMPPVRVF